MNRCHWHPGLLLFCPLQSHMIFLLTFECVPGLNVSGQGKTHSLGTAATEKPKRSSGWLAQQHLTVSILSNIVYAWGGFGSSLCQTALHHVLAGKMTYCVTLVHLRNVQLLIYRIYVYLVLEHLCYLYIVFLHSYGLWMPWWVCLIVVLSTCFFLFVLHDWILWMHCSNWIEFFMVSGCK